VPLAVFAGDPSLGDPTYAADRPERDTHADVEEGLFPGDGGGDLDLELN
jgi:hypothetical protein